MGMNPRKCWMWILFWSCVTGEIYFCPGIAAQEASASGQASAVQHQTTKDVVQQPAAASPSETKPEEKHEKKHRLLSGSFVFVPEPIVSPALGTGLVPIAGYIFPFEEKGKTAPQSVVGAAGLITDDGSRAFGLGENLYLKQARYELKSAYGHGNLDYNLYGVGY